MRFEYHAAQFHSHLGTKIFIPQKMFKTGYNIITHGYTYYVYYISFYVLERYPDARELIFQSTYI